MTVNGSTPGHDAAPRRPLCGAKKHQGEGTCTQAAGWGTSHPGIGRCKLHGGATQSHEAAARQTAAAGVLRRVWNPDATPVTDSVAALQRLAGRLDQAVDVIGAQLTVGEPCELCGRGDMELEPVNAAAWIRTVRELRTALAEMERLGIASRGLEITEQLAGELGSAVRRILDRFGLSEEQLLLVPVVVPEELRRITVEQLPAGPGDGGGA